MSPQDRPGESAVSIVRPLHVAVMGTWNWLDVAAELLRRAGMSCEAIPDLPGAPAFLRFVLRGGLNRFDAVHHVRGASWFPGTVFAAIGKPVVWHWIGTDILGFRTRFWRGRGIRPALARRAVHQWARGHLADSPDLANELASCGIRSEVVRLLPKAIEADVQPLPASPGVLSYWAPEHRDFYHAPVVMKLAETFPQVPFLIVGDDGKGFSSAPPPNVTFLGRLPSLAEVYPRISIYLRLVEHDSLSAMVLEALARGRYVIYSKELPHTETAESFDKAAQTLTALLRRDQPNTAGSAYVRQAYSLTEQADRLRRLYNQWFVKPAVTRNSARCPTR